MGWLNCSFSDERGILFPYTPDPSNPGDTRMLRGQELKALEGEKKSEGEKRTLGGEKKSEGVPAVLLQDLLSLISSNTVILKVDVQGYECRVREGLDRKYPFIFFINNLDCWQGQQDMKIVFFQTLQPSILSSKEKEHLLSGIARIT